MRRENIDGWEFALVNQGEYKRLKEAWLALDGATIDDEVGDGVSLFLIEDSVQFRVRVDQDH